MKANPETLKYKIGQSITWKDSEGIEHQSIVANIHYNGLEIYTDWNKTELIAFESVVKEDERTNNSN